MKLLYEASFGSYEAGISHSLHHGVPIIIAEIAIMQCCTSRFVDEIHSPREL